MQLTLLVPTTPTATVFTLADDTTRAKILPGSFANGAGGNVKEGFRTKQKRKVQKSDLFRAPYLAAYPRFNLENGLMFTVDRSFDTAETCINFIATHPDSIPACGTLRLVNQDNGGRVTRSLPKALLESVECTEHIGASCKFIYVFSSASAWS